MKVNGNDDDDNDNDDNDDNDDDDDDDGDHPLLLSITVARRDCPTLSFAALGLHVHLRENFHPIKKFHLKTSNSPERKLNFT